MLLVIHLVNVAGTSLGQQFRLAFPLYLGALLTLPLLALPSRVDRVDRVDEEAVLVPDDGANEDLDG